MMGTEVNAAAADEVKRLSANGAEFASYLNRASVRFYGAAIREFVRSAGETRIATTIAAVPTML